MGRLYRKFSDDPETYRYCRALSIRINNESPNLQVRDFVMAQRVAFRMTNVRCLKIAGVSQMQTGKLGATFVKRLGKYVYG